MSEKRRDNKGRILRTGESQRADGRYMYKYVNRAGETKVVYSWKLVATDRVPKGKRDDLSLREKEREIQRDLEDGIDTKGKKMTLCELYAKKTAQRSNVKKNTQAGRKYLMDALKQDKLGSRSIDSIKPSDAKEWAVRMKEKGYGFKTISNYKRSLKASFYMAIEDDYVRKNPFDFQLSEVIDDDSESRQALSEEQEEQLLSFLQHDTVYQKYYDDVLILLKTGLRISELCGLTAQDLDFENHTINIDHQLLRNQEGYYIETPKTKCGIRKVPMSEEAGKAFQRVLKRKKTEKGIVIDGYRNFLFLNQKGMPMTACYYTSTLRNIVKKYNKCHDEPLPKITPHILRHTFCTRLAQKNMNPKNLQYIMGHSSIMITLNLYAHASQTGANMEMRSLIA
ncbi:TPA: site-specific integrase [Clostridioides difficile]|nr:site-specific integrase [Clostridioides difficile]